MWSLEGNLRIPLLRWANLNGAWIFIYCLDGGFGPIEKHLNWLWRCLLQITEDDHWIIQSALLGWVGSLLIECIFKRLENCMKPFTKYCYFCLHWCFGRKGFCKRFVPPCHESRDKSGGVLDALPKTPTMFKCCPCDMITHSRHVQQAPILP